MYNSKVSPMSEWLGHLEKYPLVSDERFPHCFLSRCDRRMVACFRLAFVALSWPAVHVYRPFSSLSFWNLSSSYLIPSLVRDLPFSSCRSHFLSSHTMDHAWHSIVWRKCQATTLDDCHCSSWTPTLWTNSGGHHEVKRVDARKLRRQEQAPSSLQQGKQ